jgi:hypothetical protein
LIYHCYYYTAKSDDAWNPTQSAIYDISVALSLFASAAVTIVSSVMLIVLAKRVTDRGSGGLKMQGVLTVLITAAFHTLISLPLMIFFATCFFYDQHLIVHHMDKLHVSFRYAWFIGIIISVANFYIFCLTLPSFRHFLWARIGLVAASIKNCFPNGEGHVDETE